MLKTHTKLCMTSRIFLKNCLENGEYGQKKWAKLRFFEFIEEFGHCFFFLNFIYNESLYFFLNSCTNPIFRKTPVPKIWTKVIVANQIVGFLNQLYLWNKTMKKSVFLHVDTNSWEIKVYWKCFWLGLVKSGSNHRTLKQYTKNEVFD